MLSSCSDVDFNDIASLRSILTDDKHTRIEGLCSEHLFMEEIGSLLNPIVSDYWMSGNYHQYYLTRFVTDTQNRLTENDFSIFEKFRTMNIPVRIVYYDESRKIFLETFYKKDKHKKYTKPTECEFKPLQELKDGYCDEERFNKAFEFLLSRQNIKSVVLRRLFANHIMDNYSWDLDGFHITKNKQIILFEIKHKFPAANDTFGINVGQANMFRHLTKNNIKVIHTILLKPRESEDISAIDLVTDSRYRPTSWIYTLFDYSKLILVEKAAPEKTQLRGEKTIKYYEIKRDRFKNLKILGIPSTSIQEDIYRIAELIQ